MFALRGNIGFSEYQKEQWGRIRPREVKLIYMELINVLDLANGEPTNGSIIVKISPEVEQYLMRKLNKQIGVLGTLKRMNI